MQFDITLHTDQEHSLDQPANFGASFKGVDFEIKWKPDDPGKVSRLVKHTLTIRSHGKQPNPLSMNTTYINEFPGNSDIEGFASLNEYVRAEMIRLYTKNRRRWERHLAQQQQQKLF